MSAAVLHNTDTVDAHRDLLRLVICGSVDDGKSTFLGRLLAETNSLNDDEIARLESLSRRYGAAGSELDYALLLDGLEAEREQGITIDVAYRYFGTERQSFIVADTPGHEQYTRNMVTGASNAELAVLLVDVRGGLTTQTKRHSRIVALLGIRNVVVLVNKMDLVGFAADPYNDIRSRYESFAADLGFDSILAIPVSALFGDNICRPSANTPWYSGATVLAALEGFRLSRPPSPLRFLVQSVVRTNKFRGYAGFVGSGSLRDGDEIVVSRSGQKTNVARISTFGGDRESAECGEAVTLVTSDHLDISRGDIISHGDSLPALTDQFAAHLVWFSEAPLLPGRIYTMKIGTQDVPVSVTALRHKIDIDNGHKAAAEILAINEIGFAHIASAVPVAVDPYVLNRTTGSFILIDKATAATIGAGMIAFSLRRADNVKAQSFDVSAATRAQMKAQRPAVIWLTGLPGSGKSTIAGLVDKMLTDLGFHTYVLDGDNVRKGLSRDLGFTDVDRVENIRRVGEVARLMTDAGLIVLCAFVSPFREEREMVRGLIGGGKFVEVFVDTPIDVCKERDPKGLYAKASKGLVFHVTGVDSPYEKPLNPEFHLDTTTASASALAEQLVADLIKNNMISRIG